MSRHFLPSLAVTLAVLFAATSVCEAQNYGVAKDLARKAIRAAEGKRPAEPKPQKPKRPSTKPPPPTSKLHLRVKLLSVPTYARGSRKCP